MKVTQDMASIDISEILGRPGCDGSGNLKNVKRQEISNYAGLGKSNSLEFHEFSLQIVVQPIQADKMS